MGQPMGAQAMPGMTRYPRPGTTSGMGMAPSFNGLMSTMAAGPPNMSSFPAGPTPKYGPTGTPDTAPPWQMPQMPQFQGAPQFNPLGQRAPISSMAPPPGLANLPMMGMGFQMPAWGGMPMRQSIPNPLGALRPGRGQGGGATGGMPGGFFGIGNPFLTAQQPPQPRPLIIPRRG